MAVKKARKGKRAKSVRKVNKRPSTTFRRTGPLYAWKKLINKAGDVLLCKLLIPTKARRLQFPNRGNKCRAESAKVLGIWKLKYFNDYSYDDPTVGKPVKTGYSIHKESFKYIVGKIVTPDWFDEDAERQCSDGIHFFMRKEDALNYCV